MVAIEKASEMFNSLGLEKFQAEGLLRLYAEYLDSNKMRNKARMPRTWILMSPMVPASPPMALISITESSGGRTGSTRYVKTAATMRRR